MRYAACGVPEQGATDAPPLPIVIHGLAGQRGNGDGDGVWHVPPEPQQRITPITGEELQVKFLSDSEENALKYWKEW
jgi:hypothetical protein